jgi:hypothetical protein
MRSVLRRVENFPREVSREAVLLHLSRLAVSSEAALLELARRREEERDAAADVLRRIGESRLVQVEDVTTVRTPSRDDRAAPWEERELGGGIVSDGETGDHSIDTPGAPSYAHETHMTRKLSNRTWFLLLTVVAGLIVAACSSSTTTPEPTEDGGHSQS